VAAGSVKPQRLIRPFASLDEYFEAVRSLVADLRSSGHEAAADELREGLGCLNGLTDGWAAFAEAADAVRDRHASGLTPAQRTRLGEVRRVAWRVTRR